MKDTGKMEKIEIKGKNGLRSIIHMELSCIETITMI